MLRENLEQIFIRETGSSFKIEYFLRKKECFEQYMVAYCAEFVKHIKDLYHLSKRDTMKEFVSDMALIVTGRSGVGLEKSVRSALRAECGHTPLTVRLATGGALLDEDESYPSIPQGDISEWERDKIDTPVLDSIFQKSFDYAIVCDTVEAAGRTIKQAVFALKPYSINTIEYIRTVSQKQPVISPITMERMSVLGRDIVSVVITIPITSGEEFFSDNDFDYLSIFIASLSAGVEKTPTQFLIEEGKQPPPLRFVSKEHLSGGAQKQLSMYLETLGEIGDEVYKELYTG